MSTPRYCFLQASSAWIEMISSIRQNSDSRAVKYFGTLFHFYLTALGADGEFEILMNNLAFLVRQKHSQERTALIKAQIRNTRLKLEHLEQSLEM